MRHWALNMEEVEEDVMEPQIIEIPKARLICGRVEHLAPDGLIERLEVKPDMPIPMHP